MGQRGEPLWALALVLALTSCASFSPTAQVQFQSFEEPQQVWPTQPVGLMHVVDGLPVYGLEQAPAEPYDILGFITVNTPAGSGPLGASLEKAVVQRARQEDGHAVVLTAQEPVAGPFTGRQSKFLVLRFRRNPSTPVLERVKVYLALHPPATNSTGRSDAELELEQWSQSALGSTNRGPGALSHP